MLSLAVVCEGPADQRTGCDLADRVFCDEVTWLEPDLLPHCRQWRGVKTATLCVLWRELRGIAHSKGIRVPHGHFEGKPGKADAAAARRAIRVLMAADRPPHGIVLLRDADREPERRKGLEQARQDSQFDVPIAIGVAVPMRECWVLAGFDPQDDSEREELNSLRSELGFDPREKSHLLDARRSEDKRCQREHCEFSRKETTIARHPAGRRPTLSC